MPKPQALASVLREIRELAERKTVECPCFCHVTLAGHIGRPCFPVCSARRIPNPAYAGILAVVREICPVRWYHYREGYSHADCDSTGYITRFTYWEQANNGALRGAWEDALYTAGVPQLWGTFRLNAIEASLLVRDWLKEQT